MQDTSGPDELPNGSTAASYADVFCASCFSPVDDHLEACPVCGVALIGAVAGEASKRARAEAATHRLSGRVPSLLIVIGMWLILLPGLLVAFQMGLGAVDGRIRTRILIGVVFWAYGSVLYKITSRYVDAKRS